MAFEETLQQFVRALDDEINAVRSGGGQKTYLTDGRYLGARDGWHIYSFTADAELHFPDDTPVDLEYRGTKHTGLIVSIEAFDLVLALSSHLGDGVATAILYTAPWFLLVELQKRLSTLSSQPSSRKALAERLLGTASLGRPPDLSRAQQLLTSIGTEFATALVYNEHQLQAIGHVLANDITFVWGPPGTGKTKALGLASAVLAEAQQTVLIVAHSNIAVDVAMLQVAKNLERSPLYGQGKVLRYGVTYLQDLDAYPKVHVRGVLREQNPELMASIESLEKQRQQLVRRSRSEGLSNAERQQIKDQLIVVKKDLESLRTVLKQKEAELIGRAAVVGCTLSKATIAPEVHLRDFDAVLIDEASMAYIPHCAFATSLARQRTAVFGDFRQLAPICQADTALAQRWLQRDIFDEAGIIDRVDGGQADPRLVLLATQYRMHPTISAVPNRLFYGGRLKDSSEVLSQTAPIVLKAPEPRQALSCYDLSELQAHCFSDKESHSRFNLVSALAATELAYAALQAGHSQIGIVTPYNAQSRLVHRMLQDLSLPRDRVHVATVHRFQGSERDVILFDTVEGPPKKPGRLLFGELDTTASRLANVAVSRPRGKFVALVNCDYVYTQFQRTNSFRRLVEAVSSSVPTRHVRWPHLDGHGLWELGLPGLDYYSSAASAKQQIEHDLQEAREEIAIHWPAARRDYHFSPHVLKCCDPRRVRFSITGQGSREFYIGLQNTRLWDNRSALSMGVVGIDRQRLWVYLDPASSIAPVLRLGWPQTSKLLYAYWCLVVEEDANQPTLEERIQKGRSPISMPCPQCGSGLWPQTGRYGVYLACAGGCGYTKRITPADATNLARLMGITCGECGAQVQGRSSYRGVFLGCTNYPDCRWTKSLEEIV